MSEKLRMERAALKAALGEDTRRLFADARARDELSFLFAVLGINSGMEDQGWQPIGETHALVRDLVGLINAPLYDEARVRMGLLLYCHIIEASYMYHVIYNLLLSAEGEPPKVFSFLDQYRNGVPPSVPAKLEIIKERAAAKGYDGLIAVFEDIIRPDIRNAFFHSDYILYEHKLRLKHRGSQIQEIDFDEVFDLVGKTTDFFDHMLGRLIEAQKSFPKNHVIRNRKNAAGQNLCSIKVLVNAEGYATGFQSSDPLPLW